VSRQCGRVGYLASLCKHHLLTVILKVCAAPVLLTCHCLYSSLAEVEGGGCGYSSFSLLLATLRLTASTSSSVISKLVLFDERKVGSGAVGANKAAAGLFAPRLGGFPLPLISAFESRRQCNVCFLVKTNGHMRFDTLAPSRSLGGPALPSS
jgi:hypothetical protein